MDATSFSPETVTVPVLATERELAEFLRLTVKALRAQRQRGRGLPFLRLPGGTIRYSVPDVLAAIERG